MYITNFYSDYIFAYDDRLVKSFDEEYKIEITPDDDTDLFLVENLITGARHLVRPINDIAVVPLGFVGEISLGEPLYRIVQFCNVTNEIEVQIRKDVERGCKFNG